MNVDEIEAFLCVAELGNFSKASLKLHRTQPAISRRISLLEQSLQATLFERTARAARLTVAGRAFLPHAQAVRAALRDGARAVRDAGQVQRAAPVTLAIVGTLADSNIVAVLRKFEASVPGAAVSLITGTSREVSELVCGGEVELGLRYFADADPSLLCEQLGTERMHVVVPSGHRVRARRLPDLSSLAGEAWLGFRKDRGQVMSYGHLLERELLACAITAPKIMTVDSLTAQKRLVEAGLGIALMPLSSCREELKIGSLRAIHIDRMHAALPVVVIRRRESYVSTASETFLQLLRRHHGLDHDERLPRRRVVRPRAR
jgi:DNA-binding transcriptional LysR family regulator